MNSDEDVKPGDLVEIGAGKFTLTSLFLVLQVDDQDAELEGPHRRLKCLGVLSTRDSQTATIRRFLFAPWRVVQRYQL